jgi:hypothetical protein
MLAIVLQTVYTILCQQPVRRTIMKLDRIKFAKLIAFISYASGCDFSSDVNYIDDLIDFDVEPNRIYPQVSDINLLMELMASGNRKIEAIKLYRKLTGHPLKESKEQVEKYWPPLSNHYDPFQTDATLGDILSTVK